ERVVYVPVPMASAEALPPAMRAAVQSLQGGLAVGQPSRAGASTPTSLDEPFELAGPAGVLASAGVDAQVANITVPGLGTIQIGVEGAARSEPPLLVATGRLPLETGRLLLGPSSQVRAAGAASPSGTAPDGSSTAAAGASADAEHTAAVAHASTERDGDERLNGAPNGET